MSEYDPSADPRFQPPTDKKQTRRWWGPGTILTVAVVVYSVWPDVQPGGRLHTLLLGADVEITRVTVTQAIYDWNDVPAHAEAIVEVANRTDGALTGCRIAWGIRPDDAPPQRSDPFDLQPGELRGVPAQGPGVFRSGEIDTGLRVLCEQTRSPGVRRTIDMRMKGTAG